MTDKPQATPEQQERSLIVHYLRRCAKERRRYARNLLADTMQSKPQADREEEIAHALESVAGVIENGMHLR